MGMEVLWSNIAEALGYNLDKHMDWKLHNYSEMNFCAQLLLIHVNCI